MSTTEINKPQLRIHQLTKDQYTAIPGTDLENDSLYAVDLELGKNGAKLLQSNTSGDIEETDLSKSDLVTDVKINGTSITSSGTANIPQAALNTRGVVSVATAASSGISINSGNGAIFLQKATDAMIEAKTNNYQPLVSGSVDKAVMEGLGNNSLTWSDAYKQSARTTIGAGATTIELIDL